MSDGGALGLAFTIYLAGVGVGLTLVAIGKINDMENVETAIFLWPIIALFMPISLPLWVANAAKARGRRIRKERELRKSEERRILEELEKELKQ